MNCEAFTYSAHETDYSVARAAGPQEALFIPSNGPFSAALIQFWMWMPVQFSACLDTLAAPRALATEPSHIFQMPSADPAAPIRTVRVNRAMMRRLRRLQRLQPLSYFEGPSIGDELKRLGLTMAQYTDYMIRRKKWNRVRLFGLGVIKRKFKSQARKRFRLRGRAANLDMAGPCNAILAPD